MCIARKEDVGEIVIPRRRYSIDIHTPLKCLRIMRGECRRRLIESVGRTLYVVAEIPREDGDRQDDHPCRRAKLTLTRPASACETHAPRKLIQRHCRTSLRTNSNDAIIAWNTPRVQSVKIALYEKRQPYEAHRSSYSSPSSSLYPQHLIHRLLHPCDRRIKIVTSDVQRWIEVEHIAERP